MEGRRSQLGGIYSIAVSATKSPMPLKRGIASFAALVFVISALALVVRQPGSDAESLLSQGGPVADLAAPVASLPPATVSSIPRVDAPAAAAVRVGASLLPPLGQPKPAPTTTTTPPPPPPLSAPAAPSALLGVNDLMQFSANYADYETWQGHGTRTHDAVVDLFLSWNQATQGRQDDTFISAMTAKWNQGSVPMVTWMLPIRDSLLVSGWYDSYMTGLVVKFREWLSGPDGIYGNSDDRRMYLRPAPEANGDWNPWSPDYGHPQPNAYKANVSNFKAGWARVHTIFDRGLLDSTHVQWVFAVNNIDAYRVISSSDWHPEPIAEDIYPGNDLVDWTAVDGYQRTTSDTPDVVFNEMVGRLLKMSDSAKPVGITEYGSYGPDGVDAKNAWLDSYFTWLANSPVRMSLYWNTYDPKNGSTAIEVFGISATGDSTYTSPSGVTYNAVSHYASNVAGNSHLTTGDLNNPRLLTDQQFSGQ